MIKKNYYQNEIKKILILFGFGFIIFGFLIFYLFLAFYSENMIKVRNIENNKVFNQRINNELQYYKDQMLRIDNENIFAKYLKDEINPSILYSELYKTNNQTNMKFIFYLVNAKGETVLTNNYVKSPYNNYDIFLSGLFKQMKNNMNEIIYMNNKIQIDLTKRTIYSIGKAIKINGQVKGYIVFDILESELKKIISETTVDEIFITDQYNNVILSSDNIFIDDIGKFKLANDNAINRGKVEYKNGTYYYSESKLLNDKLKIITLSDVSWIDQMLKVLGSFSVIIMLGVTIAIILIADYISNKKTSSIRKLIKSINKVQSGDLKTRVNINSGDEFELIGNQFNEMLEKLERLIEKNNELINRNRIAEIKQLESQFNPHFIFNTLETLKYMVSIDKQQAINIIISFANILRYSINYETKIITLAEDVSYLKNYFAIQKHRYNERLNYDLDISEEVSKVMVPKLILQPIVENCINHNFNNKEYLKINLKAKLNDELLIISVKDNGDGINKERLAEIRKMLDENSIESNNIGLLNVQRRINLLFNANYKLKIDSVINEYTEVIIRIPLTL